MGDGALARDSLFPGFQAARLESHPQDTGERGHARLLQGLG